MNSISTNSHRFWYLVPYLYACVYLILEMILTVRMVTAGGLNNVLTLIGSGLWNIPFYSRFASIFMSQFATSSGSFGRLLWNALGVWQWGILIAYCAGCLLEAMNQKQGGYTSYRNQMMLHTLCSFLLLIAVANLYADGSVTRGYLHGIVLLAGFFALDMIIIIGFIRTMVQLLKK